MWFFPWSGESEAIPALLSQLVQCKGIGSQEDGPVGAYPTGSDTNFGPGIIADLFPRTRQVNEPAAYFGQSLSS